MPVMTFKQNLVIALLGIIGTLIATLISVAPDYWFGGTEKTLGKEEAALLAATVDGVANLVEMLEVHIDSQVNRGEDGQLIGEQSSSLAEYKFLGLYIRITRTTRDFVEQERKIIFQALDKQSGQLRTIEVNRGYLQKTEMDFAALKNLLYLENIFIIEQRGGAGEQGEEAEIRLRYQAPGGKFIGATGRGGSDAAHNIVIAAP